MGWVWWVLAACTGGGQADVLPGTDDGGAGGVDPDICADRGGQQFCDGLNAVLCSDGGEVASTEVCAADSTICSEGQCADCAPALHAVTGDLRGGLYVPVDNGSGPYDERRFIGHRVTLEGRAQLSWSGSFEVWHDETATELASGDILDGPATVVVRATTTGAGVLDAAPVAPCGAAPVSVDLTAVSGGIELAGRSLDAAPHFEFVRVINGDDQVEIAIDPGTWPDRPTGDAWVVPHRTPAEWAADATLSGGSGATSITVGADFEGSRTVVWGSGLPTGPELMTAWDVVVDVDGNGQLDPGDLIDGFDAPGLHVGGDLAQPGPYTPIEFGFSESFWITSRVYAPSEPDLATLDPLPLIVISHGNGHDYTWYDYLGNHLASWGYVVMSHRNDTQPGPLTAAATTWQNTEAFLSNLSTLGNGMLDGQVDSSQIVWIGHSRGGEGVVIAYNWVDSGQVTPTTFSASDIVLVSSIAPTLFEPGVAQPHGVPYHNLSGASDGDVTGGPDCDLCMYFRIFQAGNGPHWATYVHGATHNDFNCCGFNDGAFVNGPKIGRPAAQQLAKSYYMALFEAHLRGNDVFFDYLHRAPERFRPFETDVVLASFSRPAQADRIVIDDFQSNPDAATSSSGGTVSSDLPVLIEGALDDGNSQLSWNNGDPMNGMTWSHNDPDPERGIVFEWSADDDGGFLAFDLPASMTDWSGHAALQFRACQGTRHPLTIETPGLASMSVQLVDGAGATATIDHGTYGGLPQPYARTGLGNGTGWVNEFQTIRMPLPGFSLVEPALDLTDIQQVRFLVGASYGSPTGRIGFDDLELIPEAP